MWRLTGSHALPALLHCVQFDPTGYADSESPRGKTGWCSALMLRARLPGVCLCACGEKEALGFGRKLSPWQSTLMVCPSPPLSHSLSAHPSIPPPNPPSPHTPFLPPCHPSICLSIYLSILLSSIHPFTPPSRSVHPSFRPFIPPFIPPSIPPSLHPSIHPLIHPSIHSSPHPPSFHPSNIAPTPCPHSCRHHLAIPGFLDPLKSLNSRPYAKPISQDPNYLSLLSFFQVQPSCLATASYLPQTVARYQCPLPQHPTDAPPQWRWRVLWRKAWAQSSSWSLSVGQFEGKNSMFEVNKTPHCSERHVEVSA